MQKPTYFVCRVDCLTGILCLVQYAQQKSLILSRTSEDRFTFSLHYCLEAGNYSLSQFILKFAMEIRIRKWTRRDLAEIHRAWLDHYKTATRSDMRLRSDAEPAMKNWLDERFRDSDSFGFVAEAEDRVVAFLMGRVSDYESVPPVIHSRRIGIIDAVYVFEQFRRQGIGALLVDHALLAMKVLNAVAAETIYEAFDQNAADLWQRAGFEPWMVHAYRML